MLELLNFFLLLFWDYRGSYAGLRCLLQQALFLKIIVGVYVGVELSSKDNSLFMSTVFLLTLSVRNSLCTLQDKVCICLKYLYSNAIETS